MISEVKPEPKPASKPAPKPVEKPVAPEPAEPAKPVTPAKPVAPSVVSSSKESKSENNDYVNYGYDTVYDSNKAKGTSGISKEGSKGYTTYNYTRTVTKYSDGTVKYSDWSVASKNVVAPVNGVKWVGTYEEPQKQGYYNSEAAYEAAAINSARVANGLPEATYTLDNESAKLTKEYGHLGNGGGCIGTGSGYNIVDAWMASGGHRDSILNKGITSFAIGAYTDKEDVTYFIFYWVE